MVSKRSSRVRVHLSVLADFRKQAAGGAYKVVRKAVIAALTPEALTAAGLSGLPVEVDVHLTNDEEIRELNRRFRGVGKATDVLSFGMGDDMVEGAGRLLGQVVISLPRASAQAGEYAHSLERELGFLSVHGVLHLLGYDHDTAAGEALMRQMEEEALGSLGLSR